MNPANHKYWRYVFLLSLLENYETIFKIWLKYIYTNNDHEHDWLKFLCRSSLLKSVVAKAKGNIFREKYAVKHNYFYILNIHCNFI